VLLLLLCCGSEAAAGLLRRVGLERQTYQLAAGCAWCSCHAQHHYKQKNDKQAMFLLGVCFVCKGHKQVSDEMAELE
jgi:hypothetical protein